jgi:hypothetical protein
VYAVKPSDAPAASGVPAARNITDAKGVRRTSTPSRAAIRMSSTSASTIATRRTTYHQGLDRQRTLRLTPAHHRLELTADTPSRDAPPKTGHQECCAWTTPGSPSLQLQRVRAAGRSGPQGRPAFTGTNKDADPAAPHAFNVQTSQEELVEAIREAVDLRRRSSERPTT